MQAGLLSCFYEDAKAFHLSLFVLLQVKIRGVSEMVNALSARMLVLTSISAVLTYSSGLALCPRKRNGSSSSVQKYF